MPFIYLILYFVGAAALIVILGGVVVTFTSIMETLGIIEP